MSISTFLHSIADRFDPGIYHGPIESVTKSSKGEKFIMAMFPGIQGIRSPFTWSTNRLELVNHFRGWQYIAIRAIAEEFAGVMPLLARVHSGAAYAEKRDKAMRLKGLKRREAFRDLHKRFLPDYIRRKALAPVQEHEELEPLPSDHDALRLLSRPNPIDTWFTFAYKLVMFQELCGSSYIWCIRNGYGEPTELWVLPSHWMWPQPGKTELIAGYEVRPVAGFQPVEMGVGWFMGGTGYTQLKADDVILFQYPNPMNIFDGQSPLMAVADWVQTAESIDSSRVAHFTNGMFPGVAVEIDKEIADPSDDMRERLKHRIISEFAGVSRTKKPVILSPGVKLVPWTAGVEEMDYVNSADQLKSYLLAAHKVGPSQVGLAEEVTFASMVAAKANFHQSTMRPKFLMYGQILTERFIKPYYGEDLILYWHDSTPEDPEYLLRKWDTAVKNGCATPDEFRQHVLACEPLPDGKGENPILPNTMSPFVNPDEFDDVPLPALAAMEVETEQEKAKGALERGEGALESADKKPRQALGEGNGKPPETPGEKSRNRLRQMTAKSYRNGTLNGTHA